MHIAMKIDNEGGDLKKEQNDGNDGTRTTWTNVSPFREEENTLLLYRGSVVNPTRPSSTRAPSPRPPPPAPPSAFQKHHKHSRSETHVSKIRDMGFVHVPSESTFTDFTDFGDDDHDDSDSLFRYRSMRSMMGSTGELYRRYRDESWYDDEDDYEDGFVELISRENADKLRSIVDTLRIRMKNSFREFGKSKFRRMQLEWMKQQHEEFQRKIQVKFGTVEVPKEALQAELTKGVAIELQETLEAEDTEIERSAMLLEEEQRRREALALQKEEEERKRLEERERIAMIRPSFLPIRLFQHLVDPEGHLSTVFLMIILLSFFYNLMVTPFRIAFLLPRPELEHWITVMFAIIDVTFDLFNICEIFLNLFAPYISVHGMMVYNVRFTSKNYLRSKLFWVDFVSAFPLDWCVIAFIPRWVPLFRLNRIARLLRFEHYFSSLEFKTGQNSATIRIVKLISIQLIVAHYFNCMFNIILIVLQSDLTQSWTLNSFFHMKNIWQRYLYGAYWTLSTMAGYGLTVPVSEWQILFAQMVVFVGVVLKFMIIGTVSSLVAELNAKKNNEQLKVTKIDNYMKYRKVPMDIRRKIRQFRNYMQRSRQGWDEDKILDDLPQYLRTEVAMNVNRAIIEKVPLFNIEGISDTFISSLVTSFKSQVVLPNSVIVRKGDVGREMFFIVSGYVEIVLDNGAVVAQLHQGSFFGEIALINNVRRTATVRAGTFVDLYILTKDKFDEIAQDYPEVVQAIKKEAARRNEDARQKQQKNEQNREKG